MRIELRISCTNLPSRDLTSASDPCAVVKLKDKQGKFHEIGRTERIKNCADPTFTECIEMDYRFEEMQTLQFKVYDIDNLDTESMKDDDGLGKAEANLGQIVAAKTYSTKLKSKHSDTAKITITATEITNVDELVFNASAVHLDNKDFLGKSDPYLCISKRNGSAWTVVHRTKVIKNDLNPTWGRVEIRMTSLCDGDINQDFLVECFDYDSDGDHDLIGQLETSVGALIGQQTHRLPLINPKKKAKKKSYLNSGELVLENSKICKVFSFLDYIMGGCGINFTCGIDFTGSNGDPRDVNSLHYVGNGQATQYAIALQSVGYIVQDYDSDRLFPALGFGAKIPPENEVSHEFALNFNPSNPYCAGIDGILQAYYNAINNVKLWGPTNFAPIINHVARFAQQAAAEGNGASQYYVLMMLTDGVVTDIDETCQALVAASHLPMSVIIVGVGNADFSLMEFLDGDDGSLVDRRGNTAARDIVQFVPFRDFQMSSSPERLASTVLAELPKQLVKYFKMKNLAPVVPPR